MKVYNKLVRDKIPEIIKADGKECKTRILSKDEYIAALETKLNEEVAEYQEDKNLEEMADVLEVLQAICLARGYSLDELEAMRIKKAKERGGFKDKIFQVGYFGKNIKTKKGTTMTTNHLILDFSHVYCDENIPKNTGIHWLDCSEIEECDLYCSRQAEEKIREKLSHMEFMESVFWIPEIIIM